MPSQRNKHILDTYLGLTLSTLSSDNRQLDQESIEKMLRGIKKYLDYAELSFTRKYKTCFECRNARQRSLEKCSKYSLFLP